MIHAVQKAKNGLSQCLYRLALQTVQVNPGFQLKDIFHEKIVVLYFWTYSNIHSGQMTPKLITIDKRYSTAGVSRWIIIDTSSSMNCVHFQVSVIGVHSPKYEHEKNKANIRHAMEEQSISFNVVNDHSLQAWKHVGCQLWPTVLVFGPDALPLYIFEGENHVQHIEPFLIPLLAHYKSSVRASASSSTAVVTSPEDIVSGIKSKLLDLSTYLDAWERLVFE